MILSYSYMEHLTNTSATSVIVAIQIFTYKSKNSHAPQTCLLLFHSDNITAVFYFKQSNIVLRCLHKKSQNTTKAIFSFILYPQATVDKKKLLTSRLEVENERKCLCYVLPLLFFPHLITITYFCLDFLLQYDSFPTFIMPLIKFISSLVFPQLEIFIELLQCDAKNKVF